MMRERNILDGCVEGTYGKLPHYCHAHSSIVERRRNRRVEASVNLLELVDSLLHTPLHIQKQFQRLAIRRYELLIAEA
jgi:hypothetical protein